jgi:hypothetical protein
VSANRTAELAALVLLLRTGSVNGRLITDLVEERSSALAILEEQEGGISGRRRSLRTMSIKSGMSDWMRPRLTSPAGKARACGC